ncbi:G-protein alpha subunit [Exidia glandulosa HHB12029]|uniref:G-protein alpha subunit n=1 Tax=Exidia glandulosa HHB12029 TaxID=1314781 RepID=A0A165KAE4_EXIGL|nr:G-protein alpha subunit [Exidia glandulosa HHB12029]KZV96045.1 G-protein alpha subunit [Exidia glandulosa HHB12029]
MARRRLSRRVTKILLLGQAESGKSTTIKNLQLMFQPNAFHAHRKAWRAVIHLNLINSVRYILDTLQDEEDEEAADTFNRNRPSSSLTTVSAPPLNPGSSVSSTSTSSTSTMNISRPPIHLSPEQKRVRMRLSPLMRVGDELGVKLSPEYYDPKANSMTKYSSTQSTSYLYNQPGARELTVRSGSGWKAAFGVKPSGAPPTRSGGTAAEDEAARVLHACVDDIWTLWTDPIVKEVLKKRKVRLQEMSGFFLNDVQRIVDPDYEPSIDDILRARLRTQGVDEYKFTMENRGGREWWVYDVGGSRTQRAQWAQFFDDITAIIFLAPISAFDEYLPTAEDQTRMNKLEDTFLLWKDVVSNRLLAKVIIVLFMNKIDILNIKISQGVDVRKYVPRFEGNVKNSDEVTRYFKAKFKAIHKRYSPQPRPFHCFPTSAIDTQATSIILSTVREQIVRTNLEQANIL